MSEKDTKETSGRTRNFTCVVYPDSAPENWVEILSSHMIPAVISPLHDKDIIEGSLTGELKKPHYHVILMFDSVKTVEQAHEVFDSINGVYPPEIPRKSSCKIKSIRGACRYLQHLDNPDKAFYGDKEVTCLSGADYASIIELESDIYRIIAEMEEFCEKYDIVSFYKLCRYATEHRTDWKRVLATKCSFYMKEYLKSRDWTKKNEDMSIVDKDTGEVVL